MSASTQGPGATIEQMRTWIRRWGRLYLEDGNVTSLGIGTKEVEGERTGEVCIQFTVRAKLAPAELEMAPTRALPEAVDIESVEVPTDVIERVYVPSYQVVPEAFDEDRKGRMDPLRPGVSISHPTVSAGTAGAIVHDRRTGAPVVLSNWHVLHGPEGTIGDEVLQPGTHDDNSGDPRNVFGRLLRSHLGAAGDAALASLDQRSSDPSILELDVVPEEIGDPELGDRVVKSGRTTGVSHGVVARIHTMVALDYGDGAGEHSIGGFEIEPDPRRTGQQTALSDGGDSGAAWMLKAGNGHTSSVLGGLHFAGADSADGQERALACYASSVRTALGFSLSPATAQAEAASRASARGYDPDFLAEPVPFPELAAEHREDAACVDGSPVVPYTHFSLVQSASRRFARVVAWNIDGARLQRISRDGIDFRLDDRLPEDAQAGEDLYCGNGLDRGHIARRADLTWGERAEARRANEDSFCFTNIAPQMARFNQSGRGGVWGEVENSLFDQVEVQDLRVSVVGGPVFGERDREYRGVRLPQEFFKAAYYMVDDELRVQAFLLAQDLGGLERLDLSAFSTYLVDLQELTSRTGLAFAPAAAGAHGARAEKLEPTVLESAEQIPW
ncbi:MULTISPECIES: DNA/RNA non-specific endonuclease [unclassified Brachybacterium]|uniref:DNA/RNA non-specific endonuclease n=1 Tax=unclassified Brachybacterium TaxID=2623841 RepID=UPI00360A80F9